MAEGSGPERRGLRRPAPRRRPAGRRPASRAATGRDHGLDLVYCSRAGSPAQPWLEPDVNDHLEALVGRRRAGRRAGADRLRLRPHGGRLRPRHRGLATAERLGLPVARAATAGIDPRFVAVVRDLVLERAAVERGAEPVRRALGELGPAATSARPAAAPTRGTPSGPPSAEPDPAGRMRCHARPPPCCSRLAEDVAREAGRLIVDERPSGPSASPPPSPAPPTSSPRSTSAPRS